MGVDLRAEVYRRLVEDCGLSREDPLVLGLSGGPDSLCLFDLLADLGFRFTAGHLDHGIRPGSAAEAESLEAIAAGRGIPFVKKIVDVKGHAQANRQAVEEAGRELRYQFLFGLAREQRARAVLVAHHSDDQVETILMHFLRGAGLRD